jgi:hypothetical protein
MSFQEKLNKQEKEKPDSETKREKRQGMDFSESEFRGNE